MRGDHGRVARSHYRQIKLLVTQHSNGRLDYRLYGKKLNDGWQERHALVIDSLTQEPRALLTIEDVVEVLDAILREQRLPGID